jgi:hypothetical protein
MNLNGFILLLNAYQRYLKLQMIRASDRANIFKGYGR